MNDIVKQLNNLARLKVLMDNSSESARAILAEGEADKLQSQLSFSSYPEIELRWLNFQLKNLEVDDSGTTEYERKEAETRHAAYTLCAFRCKDCIETFVENHTQEAKEEGSLKKLIKEQHESIFSQCLDRATCEYLHNYHNDPSKPFSTEAILSQATAYYREKMVKEALIEFETITFIEYYARLKGNVHRGGLEQQFIEDRLNMRERYVAHGYTLATKDQDKPYDLTKFRTKEFNKFYESFWQPEPLTPEHFKKEASRFLETQSTDTTFGTIFYLHFKGETELFTAQMAPIFSQAEEFAQLSVPAVSTETPIPTEDKKLIKLRKIVENYQQYLNHHRAEEEKTYPDRDHRAVEQRQLALATIALVANQSEELSPSVKQVVKNAVEEIQKNGPTWFERSLLDKILDVISLGARPLYRLFTSQQNPAEAQLNQAATGDLPEDDNPAEDSSSERPQ